MPKTTEQTKTIKTTDLLDVLRKVSHELDDPWCGEAELELEAHLGIVAHLGIPKTGSCTCLVHARKYFTEPRFSYVSGPTELNAAVVEAALQEVADGPLFAPDAQLIADSLGLKAPEGCQCLICTGVDPSDY